MGQCYDERQENNRSRGSSLEGFFQTSIAIA